MPDGWFSQKEDVPYLYLSLNPWACSCSLGYLRRYLDDFELNIYVRDGAEIRNGVDSVVSGLPLLTDFFWNNSALIGRNVQHVDFLEETRRHRVG